MSETPTAPMSAIKNVDERLLEKLSLLEENSGKKPVEDVVTDLWSIMKQNGGWVESWIATCAMLVPKRISLYFAKLCSCVFFLVFK